VSFRDLAADHPVVEGVAAPVRCEMNVEMWDSTTENVQIDHLGLGGFPEGTCDEGEDRPKGSGFIAFEVRDMWHVAFRFEIRETGNLSLRGYCESPARVLPDLDTPKL